MQEKSKKLLFIYISQELSSPYIKPVLSVQIDESSFESQLEKKKTYQDSAYSLDGGILSKWQFSALFTLTQLQEINNHTDYYNDQYNKLRSSPSKVTNEQTFMGYSK